MDDIYDNLENYKEENIVDELRIENKELKCKLNEYASTLDKLQKDFDKLSSEYKKLELNYSSLLKTARAEIERKTKIITNLNMEKDQLVINSLLNKGIKLPKYHNINHGIGKGRHTDKQVVKGDSERLEFEKSSDNATIPNLSDNIACMTGNERKDNHDKINISSCPKVQAGSDENKVKEKEQKLKTSTYSRDRDKNKNNSKEHKETHLHNLLNDNVKSNVDKIRHRRKSMPSLNRGDFKFSSDEEQEEINSFFKNKRVTQTQEDQCFRRKSILTDSYDRKHDKDRNGRRSKESDSTRVDDRYTNYRDSSKDNYYRYNSRYNDSDRTGSRDFYRDKHETNHRSRKYYSPDRSHSNTYRMHSNDRFQRSDHVRHRVLETPTENMNQRNRDLDRHMFQNEEHNTVKHKIHDVTDEPTCKRRRTESVNWKPDENFMSQNKEIDFPYSSLQSPDYTKLESNPSVHHVKEIKNTSSTKLDDPRYMSSKYVVNTYKNKVTLSTVVGRDVQLKYIDKSTWNIDKDKDFIKMPTPLREKPQVEDLVKEIYMDIDKPILNLSLESGEIENSEEDVNSISGNRDVINTGSLSKNTHVKVNETVLNNAQSEAKIQENKIQNSMTDSVPKICPELFSKNYKIPKINKSIIPINKNNKPSEDNVLNSKHTTQTQDKKGNMRQCQKKKAEKEKKDLSKKLRHELDVHNPLKMFFKSDNKADKTKNDLDLKKQPIEKVLSVKDTVENDLELSDETSDCLELVDKKRKEKIKDADSAEVKDCVIYSRDEEINIREEQNCNEREPLKLLGFSQNKHIHLNIENNQKSLINEETKSKDIKTKFCDLFGDSSSLITPDDLGFVEPPTSNQIISELAPLLDNTQEAVDFNVREMDMVQTYSLKINHDKSNVNNEQQGTQSDTKIKSNEHLENLDNDVENSPTTENDLENNKTDILVDPNIVKTVIISTGVQNNCYSEVPVSDGDERKSSSFSEFKPNDNVLNCQAASLKALATSTPQKIKQNEQSLPVPEISCNTSNSITVKEADNVSCNSEDVSKTTNNNVDVPDVRIVIRRRRKAKAT